MQHLRNSHTATLPEVCSVDSGATAARAAHADCLHHTHAHIPFELAPYSGWGKPLAQRTTLKALSEKTTKHADQKQANKNRAMAPTRTPVQPLTSRRQTYPAFFDKGLRIVNAHSIFHGTYETVCACYEHIL